MESGEVSVRSNIQEMGPSYATPLAQLINY
jgi:hypothetical protein